MVLPTTESLCLLGRAVCVMISRNGLTLSVFAVKHHESTVK